MNRILLPYNLKSHINDHQKDCSWAGVLGTKLASLTDPPNN